MQVPPLSDITIEVEKIYPFFGIPQGANLSSYLLQIGRKEDAILDQMGPRLNHLISSQN